MKDIIGRAGRKELNGKVMFKAVILKVIFGR